MNVCGKYPATGTEVGAYMIKSPVGWRFPPVTESSQGRFSVSCPELLKVQAHDSIIRALSASDPSKPIAIIAPAGKLWLLSCTTKENVPEAPGHLPARITFE